MRDEGLVKLQAVPPPFAQPGHAAALTALAALAVRTSLAALAALLGGAEEDGEAQRVDRPHLIRVRVRVRVRVRARLGLWLG